MSSRDEKRANIINKTVELCSQFGFHGTSMDRITLATGVSKATIYKYFISKDNLIAEALQLFSLNSLEAIERDFNDFSLSFLDKLSKRFDGLMNIYVFNGCYFQLAYSEFNNTEEKISCICEDYKKTIVQLVEQLLLRENIVNAAEKAIKAEMIYNGLMGMYQIMKDKKLIFVAKEMYLKVIFED